MIKGTHDRLVRSDAAAIASQTDDTATINKSENEGLEQMADVQALTQQPPSQIPSGSASSASFDQASHMLSITLPTLQHSYLSEEEKVDSSTSKKPRIDSPQATAAAPSFSGFEEAAAAASSSSEAVPSSSSFGSPGDIAPLIQSLGEHIDLNMAQIATAQEVPAQETEGRSTQALTLPRGNATERVRAADELIKSGDCEEINDMIDAQENLHHSIFSLQDSFFMGRELILESRVRIPNQGANRAQYRNYKDHLKDTQNSFLHLQKCLNEIHNTILGMSQLTCHVAESFNEISELFRHVEEAQSHPEETILKMKAICKKMERVCSMAQPFVDRMQEAQLLHKKIDDSRILLEGMLVESFGEASVQRRIDELDDSHTELTKITAELESLYQHLYRYLDSTSTLLNQWENDSFFSSLAENENLHLTSNVMCDELIAVQTNIEKTILKLAAHKGEMIQLGLPIESDVSED